MDITNLKDEVWKPIIGYDYYQISNLGRVKSIGRVINSATRGTFTVKERILSDKINDVVLIQDGIRKTFDRIVLSLIYFDNYRPNKKLTVVDVNDRYKVLTRRKMSSIAKIVTLPNKSCKSSGVSKSRGLYLAQIQVNGKSIFLGRFTTEDNASKAYELAVNRYINLI